MATKSLQTASMRSVRLLLAKYRRSGTGGRNMDGSHVPRVSRILGADGSPRRVVGGGPPGPPDADC
jgi:hypothetical protein